MSEPEIVVYVGDMPAYHWYVRKLADEAARATPPVPVGRGVNGHWWQIGHTRYIRQGDGPPHGLRGLTGPARIVVSETASQRLLRRMPEIEHQVAIMNLTVPSAEVPE